MCYTTTSRSVTFHALLLIATLRLGKKLHRPVGGFEENHEG
jgi:hypothetical protein